MELTYSRIDLQASRERSDQLGDVLRRQSAGETWYVPFKPINFNEGSDWRVYRREDAVYIPVFPYRTAANPVDSHGYCMQLVARAMYELQGRPIRRFHLVLGDPMEEVVDNDTGERSWRFHVGFGVVLQ